MDTELSVDPGAVIARQAQRIGQLQTELIARDVLIEQLLSDSQDAENDARQGARKAEQAEDNLEGGPVT